MWSTSTSRSVQNPVAQLVDSGNLVVKEAGDDSSRGFTWQSFDHPTETLLAGMKLGRNFVTGREVYLSSWKNEEDPAPGDYTYHCDPTGYPQAIVKKGSDVVYSSGPWNGRYFSGTQNSKQGTFYTYGVYSNVTMSLEECKDICSKNCSCMAYSNSDIRGSGCLLWFGDLLDIRKGTNGLQEIYISMAASESGWLVAT